ncbi:hypothetical protein AUC68_11780 [Methyloceanibacter methanicus]|uniref:Uncharacterized protein n=1 Tax=Methyloceanibacter methanicus TaxID=1774968 RepID=A0A1E3W5I7_9HYPH|nr:hypothetical protein [Methyloceanibacter methanicus]ODS01061.1 hypothetical protein AUC68_11780 [Methyloceanibacter methanicus]
MTDDVVKARRDVLGANMVLADDACGHLVSAVHALRELWFGGPGLTGTAPSRSVMEGVGYLIERIDAEAERVRHHIRFD